MGDVRAAMTARRALRAALAVGVVLVAGGAVSAEPGASGDAWRNFASGYANSHTSRGSAHVQLEGETAWGPARVRVHIGDNGDFSGALVSFAVTCWDATRTWSVPVEGGPRQLPLTLTWNPPDWVARCELSADVVHASSGGFGHFDMAFSAIYR